MAHAISEFFGACQILIAYIIFLPILLYYCAKFRRIPLECETFKHRDKTLVYLMNLLSILSLTIEIPIDIVASVYHKEALQYISASFFMWILFILFTIKSWLLYFNLNYHYSLFKSQWKKEINPRYRSWYLLNRNTYGNLKYCVRITILPFLFYMVIITLLQYIFATDLFIYSSLTLWCLVLIPSFILYRRLTLIEDMFNIRKELFYQQTIVCVSMTMIILIGLILAIISRRLLPKTIVSEVTRIQNLANTFIESIAVFSISLISSWYPCKTHMENKRQNASRSTMSHPSTPSSTDNKPTLSVKAMLECIADRKGFSEFMKHLVQEFATENMLFLCEYIQIKYELQRKYRGIIRVKKQEHFIANESIKEDDEYITIDFNVMNTTEDTHNDLTITPQASFASTLRKAGSFASAMDPFHRCESTSVRRGRGVYSFLFMSNGELWDIIRLPSGLPKAEILNKKHCFIERIYGLFEKYIIMGTMHEINIPFVQRQAVSEMMNNVMQSEYKESEEYDEIECNMCNVLDELCIEILHLLANSYTRFASNKHSKKLSILKRINLSNYAQHAVEEKEKTKDQINLSEAEREKNKNDKTNTKIIPILRNGDSYNKLREEYQVNEIEIWPFYL